MVTSVSKRERAHAEREAEVFKHNDMIQKARFSLSIQEQRTVLYAISKIQPADTYLKEYTFEIKDFYNMIGWSNQSYTEFKAMLKGLSDKSWWVTIKREDGSEYESLVRWFTTVRSDKRSGKVTIKFHEDMMPFLIQLAKGQSFYTRFQLQYVLPMSSQYSPRLYEILKSYQYNNHRWFFDVDDLKRLLDCERYTNFNDLKRRVLDPAVEEINKYTDIAIFYVAEKEGRKVARVNFFMEKKTESEIQRVQRDNNMELDQISVFDVVQEVEEAPERAFYEARHKAMMEDRELRKKRSTGE